VGCGLKRPKKEMVRFAVRDEMIIIDIESRYGGRGWYLCYTKDCIIKLAEKGRLKGARLLSRDRLKDFLKEYGLEAVSECRKR
ncbi:MAG TPA: YlxR family protein, partial [Nitrospirae bacterium]|nr:YlxR family protein [Nitrospirota bacterium]